MQRFFAFLSCALLACAQATTVDPDAGAVDTTDAAACSADLTKDRNNCGACGTKCTAKQVCSKGACVDQCLSPMLQCGMACVDPKSDHDNCSACNKPCAMDQDCVMGACKKKCPMNQTSCDNMTCLDLMTDHDHCGDCNTACAMGETCSAGMCCPTGQTACNKTCVDTQNDPMNCNTCGFACTGMTPYCVKGTCSAKKGLKCADFKNNGNSYQQYCFSVNNQTVCIGQTSGGKISCTDTNTGIHFVFDFAQTWPMRFTLNTPTCQNYHPMYLQNLATALGYSKFTVNQTKVGNYCERTYLDNNLVFQKTAGDGTQALPYDVNFDN